MPFLELHERINNWVCSFNTKSVEKLLPLIAARNLRSIVCLSLDYTKIHCFLVIPQYILMLFFPFYDHKIVMLVSSAK